MTDERWQKNQLVEHVHQEFAVAKQDSATTTTVQRRQTTASTAPARCAQCAMVGAVDLQVIASPAPLPPRRQEQTVPIAGHHSVNNAVLRDNYQPTPETLDHSYTHPSHR